MRRVTSLVVCGNEWQVEPDARSFAHVAVDLKEAARERDDLVDDRHAEPEIISKSFRLSKVPLDFRDPCVPGFEGRERRTAASLATSSGGDAVNTSCFVIQRRHLSLGK